VCKRCAQAGACAHKREKRQCGAVAQRGEGDEGVAAKRQVVAEE